MRREKEFIRNAIVLSIGRFLPQLFSLLTIPMVTYYLTKTEYGIYDLINTMVSLLLPVATLQIHSAAFRFLIDKRKDEEGQKQIISNIYAFTFPMAFLTVICFFFLLSHMELDTRLLISLYLMLDVIFITQGQIIRGLSDNKTYTIASLISAGIKCIIIVITLRYFKSGLNGVLLAIVISYIVACIYIYIKVPMSIYLNTSKISLQLMKKLIGYSWPMIPNNLSNWILNISDRTVITFFLGVEANAVYAAANNIPNIVNMAKTVVIMAWQENASIALTDENVVEYYSNMFKKMYSLVAGFTALLIGFSPILFKILIKGSYEDAFIQVPILIIGFFYSCISSFQGGIYIAHKRTRSVGVTTMVAAIINIIVDLLLVNRMGIFAGSISTLVSYFALFIYRLIDVTKFQKMYYSYKHIVVVSIGLIIMTILEMTEKKQLMVLNILIGCIFAYSINGNTIKELISTIKKNRRN